MVDLTSTESGLTLYVVPWLIRLGQTEAALEILARRTEAGALIPYDFLLLHPRFKQIREDERFRQIVDSARPEFEMVVSVLEEARSRGELPDYLDQALTDLLLRLGPSQEPTQTGGS